MLKMAEPRARDQSFDREAAAAAAATAPVVIDDDDDEDENPRTVDSDCSDKVSSTISSSRVSSGLTSKKDENDHGQENSPSDDPPPSQQTNEVNDNDAAPVLKLTRAQGGPGRRTIVSCKAAKSTARKYAPGEVVLRQLMREAEYEIEQDSYRGVTHLLASARRSDDDGFRAQLGPWALSCCPFPLGNEDGERASNTTDEKGLPETLVQWACHNQCPTMIQWTNTALEQNRRRNGRKRKRGGSSSIHKSPEEPTLGQRPEGRSMRCKCDANPFCLATLGGAMNDVNMRDLKRRAKPLNGGAQSWTSSIFQHGAWNWAVNSNSSSMEEDDADVVEVADPNKYNRPATIERLKKIRRSVWVEESRIQSYLRNTLQDLTFARSMGDCIKLIRDAHHRLIFSNPLDAEIRPDNQIHLSIPPGIQNLGATCYLNTQLQCLAQNTVFLEGILSWEPRHSLENRDRMTKVLQLFQKLLVSMHAGPMNTIDTLEFSNALGLDHFEQQDPNEFSRLFFERIHESFQQSMRQTEAQGSQRVDSSQYGLAQLLPTLFQGVIRYEVACHHCTGVSTRKEEFMDLNLNIAKPEVKKQKTVQQTITEAFSAASDVDVQFCLDRYCLEETLTDENRYFCSICNEKRDATRRLCFQKLPPVLNVQLSRYIFDLAAQSKKKLMDKVLLPNSLTVEEKEQQDTSKENKRYVLCAVMRHQGKSAYSGHYIAEAMDWTTGEWFEFNDEKVSLLKNGPSCSVDLEKYKNKDISERTKLPQGSQDAYNLYYVEEGFLAQSVLEFMRRRQPSDCPRILNSVACERSEAYTELSQYVIAVFHCVLSLLSPHSLRTSTYLFLPTGCA